MPPITIQLLDPMNHQPQPQPHALNRQQLGLLVVVDRKHLRHPETEATGVGGHGAVGTVEALDYPRGGALSELVEEGTADGH